MGPKDQPGLLILARQNSADWPVFVVQLAGLEFTKLAGLVALDICPSLPPNSSEEGCEYKGLLAISFSVVVIVKCEFWA